MTREEKIEYLAKAVMTLGELGDNKTAYALNEIRLELKEQTKLPDGLEEAADVYSNEHNDDCFDATGIKCPHIVDAFKAGAEWMAGQGETIGTSVETAKNDEEEFPCVLAPVETFSSGDKVIVQIRKK